MAAQLDRDHHGIARAEEAVPAVQGPHRGPPRTTAPPRRRSSGTSCTTAGITAGDVIVAMIGDFADLWERAAADGTPVRAIVGDDPVEFAETFAQDYSGKQWIDKERERLTKPSTASPATTPERRADS